MTQDELKQAVAEAAINYVMPRLTEADVLGIGTGSTANYFIDKLANYKTSFAGTVASSESSAERLRQYDIPVFDLNTVDAINIYVDGADESNAKLELIKGGGAALTREKIVAANAKTFVCIADASKWVETLGTFPLPVEVLPMARNYASREITKLGGRPVLRQGVITDNGGEILDVHDLHINDPIELEQKINHITGVVTNGLFAMRPADVLLLGTPDGVKTIKAGT